MCIQLRQSVHRCTKLLVRIGHAQEGVSWVRPGQLGSGIWSAGSDLGSGIWELQLDLARIMIVRVQDCLVTGRLARGL